MTTVYFLVYASTATQDFTQDELLALLAQSRGFNEPRGISGLLLYSPGTGGQRGTFVQVLEGARAEVQALYVKITRDGRHSHCTVMEEGTLFQPRFAGWSMGFKDLSTLRPQDVPGFNPIFLKNWTLTRVLAEPDPVLRLLYSFAGA